ncbi:hypothetical protein ACP275_02G193600 [Erythranthe tilingii]
MSNFQPTIYISLHIYFFQFDWCNDQERILTFSSVFFMIATLFISVFFLAGYDGVSCQVIPFFFFSFSSSFFNPWIQVFFWGNYDVLLVSNTYIYIHEILLRGFSSFATSYPCFFFFSIL